MSNKGKSEHNSKKNSFSLWPDYSTSHLPITHENQTDAATNCDSNFHKKIKKCRTSSVRLKKMIGINSITSEDDLQVTHLSSQSYSKSLSLPQESNFNLKISNSLVGIGLLGNLSFFQAKSDGLPKSFKVNDSIVNDPNTSMPRIENKINIDGDNKYNKSAASIDLCEDCPSDKVLNSQVVDISNDATELHSEIKNIENCITGENNSSELPGNVWEMRIDGADAVNEVNNFAIDFVEPCDGYDDDTCCVTEWEARTDDHGRIFYINHLDKTTSWVKPEPCACCYRCNKNDFDEKCATFGCPTEKRQPPGALFIIRPDFYALMRKNQNALTKYNQSPQLKHMINKIRRQVDNFNKYEHNRDLVSFLNMFTDPNRRLPTGWEMRFDKSSRAFFIDHINKSTTFIDPRFPSQQTTSNDSVLGQVEDESGSRGHQPRSISMSRSIHRTMSPETCGFLCDSDKVVYFLSQSNIHNMILERCPHLLNDVIKLKLEVIKGRGVEALHEFSDDVELAMLLSYFESEIFSVDNNIPAFPKSKSFMKTSLVHSYSDHPSSPSSSKQNFQTKLVEFYKKLEYKGYASGLWKIKIEINRNKILEDSFTKILEMTKRELQRNKILVSFTGEEGLDYGGPSKEFFFLLSRELFNPCYGLFEYASCNSYLLQISPMSIYLENHRNWFRFAGRIIGLAVLHQHLLDVFFVRPFYKILLKNDVILSDLESLDYEFFKSLQWIRKGDDVDFKQLGLTFSVDEEVGGKVTEVELKSNGSQVRVTPKNRKDYADRMVKWRILRGVKEQTHCLVKGFHEVLDHHLLSKFDAHELELVISGTTEVDVDDWRRNTEYKAGYHNQHVVIGWFWSVVDELTNEMRLRLLQFVTGTSSLPHEGFSTLRGHNGPKRFSIEKWGEITSLPRAHTCFNRLDLPPYTSRQMMKRKLTIAVEETSTYGIE